MWCLPCRLVCVLTVGLSLGAGAVSSSATEAPKGAGAGTAVTIDSKSAGLPEDSALVLTGPGANAPAALLQTFNRPAAGNSLNKPATLSVAAAVHRPAADSAKEVAPLTDVQAVAVPEPTALFLAGFSGCVLLALAQRLRGSRA